MKLVISRPLILILAASCLGDARLFAQSPGAIVPVTLANTLAPNDDLSTGPVPLNIGGETGINFFGQSFTQVYVNNNGNLTFQAPLSQFTPDGLATGVGQPIIAPFFADVDTAAGGSPVMYGNAVVNGFNAFVANYVNVAYFDENDKFNSFQVILIDRSDTGVGNFDIEFNYNQIHWDTGDASDGTDGLGPVGDNTSAAVGYSNGLSGANNIFYQLPGSLVSLAFLDGGPNALISHSFNSNVLGRYIFAVRNGQVLANPLSISITSLGTFTLGNAINAAISVTGGTPPYTVTASGPLPAGISLVNNALTGTPAQVGNYSVSATVTDSMEATATGTLTYSVVSPATGLTLSGNTSLGTIALGSSISGGFSTSGGAPPYSVTALGTLPPGIVITGSGIGGVPTQPGNYSVGLNVTDSRGVGSSLTFTYSVFGFTSTSLPAGIAGSPYFGSVGIAGGNPPYSFTFSGLPHGLSANSSGGISGLINAPLTATVTVMATEGSGIFVSGPLTLSFTAPAPITVPSTTLPAGTISMTYSQALMASGGAPPYTWNLSSGTIPQGLNLRSGGTVTGIPAQTGTFSFGVRATDYTGASAVGAVSLTIATPSLTLTPSSGSLTSAMATVEYPAQTLTASGGASPYNFTVTAGSLPAGLSLSSSGGTITGTPASAGTSSFTVTATDTAGTTATAQLSILVRPLSTDLLLSTNSLTFSLAAGTGATPPSQQVTVQSTTVGTQINYSISVAPSTPWLTVTPAGGTTPGAFTVALNSQALSLAASATPYTATISVACLSPAPCTGNSQQVAVSLTIASQPPTLNLSSSLLSFTVPTSAPQATSQTLTLQDTGGGSIGFSSLSCAASWCSVSSAPGSVASGGSASVTVTADSTGLSSGYYRSLITITSSVGVYAVPVTLFVAAASSMAVEPAGAQFQVSPGGTPTGSLASFLVNVTSTSQVPWTASVSPNANWLVLSSSGGTTSATQPGSVTYSFNTSVIAGLAPQAYYGTIQVSIPGAVNSPQSYEVVLNVLPAGSPQRPQPSPAGLLFITSATSTPPAQTVSVATSSSSSVAYQLSTSTMDGANWLSATPAEGLATPGTPAVTQVSVNPSILQPGVYYGGVSYAFSGAAVRTVNVTLIVTAASTTAHDTGSPVSKATPACTASKLVPAQTGLLGNFSAPVAWPTPITILLTDDCGDTITNGQIVATFSNGDPPLALALADPQTGYYAGTWTPRTASSQVNINARASAPSLPTVTAQIAGAVTPNAAPVLAAHSTLQIFNPEVGAGLAPGTLVQVSGSGLSVANATASAGATLPTALNGTQVIIGGMAIPLQAVTPSLITAQVPFELLSGMQYQIIVSANGALTTPDTIQLTNTSPGVSTATAGLLTAYHLSGTAVSEAAPAAPSEVLFLLAAGLGVTDTPVPDGAPSPATPLANTLDMPSVTVNNELAAISFAGLQPGSVGIYQVNFTVPADAANGDLTLVLSQDGVPSNSAVLPVKKSS